MNIIKLVLALFLSTTLAGCMKINISVGTETDRGVITKIRTVECAVDHVTDECKKDDPPGCECP